MSRPRSIAEAAELARIRALQSSTPAGEPVANLDITEASPLLPRNARRQSWVWWCVVAAALFASASVVLFSSDGARTLLAVTLIASLAAVVVAARSLHRLWEFLTPVGRAVPPVVVLGLAVCFGWAYATQPTLGGTPLLYGSEQAIEVELVAKLALAHAATVADASFVDLSDEDVRTSLPKVEAAVDLRETNAVEWGNVVPPARVRAAVEAQSRFDDATAVLLRARIDAATQPSAGRAADLTRALQSWRQAASSAAARLSEAADAVGIPDPGRTWETNGNAAEGRGT
jgi:hypothetical protein